MFCLKESLSLRDFVAAGFAQSLRSFAHPFRSPRGPCNKEGLRLTPCFCVYGATLMKASFQRATPYTQKPDDFRHPAFFVAEREGFEPPDPLRSTVFKTAAFDHSAISPVVVLVVRDCKGTNNFETCKFFIHFFLLLRRIYTGTGVNKPLRRLRSCLQS